MVTEGFRVRVLWRRLPFVLWWRRCRHYLVVLYYLLFYEWVRSDMMECGTEDQLLVVTWMQGGGEWLV